MSKVSSRMLVAAAIAAAQMLLPRPALAVGNGVPFVFREGPIPAMQHLVAANSLDFTYHACVNFTDANSFAERGYVWLSSFQDAAGVVDSQINYFLANGYHLYMRYGYEANQWGGSQPTPSGTRLNYVVDAARITLHLDPNSDTVLGLADCQVTAAGTADDVLLGFANNILAGEKSETDGLANGDFEIVFGDWLFTPAGQTLFKDGFGNPLVAPIFVFNGNVTLLVGLLGEDHRTEGSGNIFWRD